MVPAEWCAVGWRFRKSHRLGRFRLTWTKKGVGWSWGIPGIRFGVSADGRGYLSFSIPGTGIYYIKYLSGRKRPPLKTGKRRPQSPKEQRSQTKSDQSDPWWKQKNL